MTTIEGTVERITFYNQENGYTVLRFRPDRKGGERLPGINLEGTLTVVGNMPDISPGEKVQFTGDFSTHPKHGLQFQAVECRQLLPVTIAGIERYLGSGLIKGIGPNLAKRIVKQFKEKTLDIIEKHPQKLDEVPGIGPDRTKKIVTAWDEQKKIKEIMLFLHAHQVSTNLALKIYKTYGDESLNVVRENPYQLEQDIYGIGFKTADRIAQKLGLPQNHPSRIEAGIVFEINEMVNDGHVYSPIHEITERASALLEVSTELVASGLNRLSASKRIRKEIKSVEIGAKSLETPTISEQNVLYGEPIIYLTPFYYAEIGVGSKIQELLTFPVNSMQEELIIEPDMISAQQRKALDIALQSPVSVITGGPGTGKTTCLKALIQRLEAQKVRYALASPTGRAAKRLSEATNQPASTIHRLLGYKPGEGFKHTEKKSLNIDFLIVDEASMLDLLLAHHLLKALKPGTQVLFVGDVDQLPSVGAGDVLRDLMDSGRVPVSCLTEIYRQKEESKIISNAHRINHGKMPIFSKSDQGDFFLFPAENAERAAEWIVDLVSTRIPNKFEMDPIRDIQVLTPMYKGAAGVDSLNELLQAQLNPGNQNKPDHKLFGRIFRQGDKVMQIRNNYDKDVFNGDIGFIEEINKIDDIITIVFDDSRQITYDFTEVDEIVLAYAISIHKSQGSEFPTVVIPMLTQHYVMLQRNLLYTAVTRAEKLCVLVGNHKALSIAINNNKVSQRFSLLSQRIKSK